MSHEGLLHDARTASRRALIGTVLLLAVLAGVLWRSVSRIGEIEGRLAVQRDTLQALERQRAELTRMVHTLVDAPDGGVRVARRRVANVKSELYDYFLWIDASQRVAVSIRNVRYTFHRWQDSVLTSKDPGSGFAVFLRAPPSACPDSATVIVRLANDSTRSYEQDLCQATLIDRPKNKAP
ncbi:MAG: hypothetical protein ABIZ70_03785 [Gemmatimonadales bacterium]